MPCGCNHAIVKKEKDERRPGPFSQCLFCAQKHADEALVAMSEYTYELENRSFLHGSIRAVVNHTFKSWPDIASKARAAALSWQSAEWRKAEELLREASAAIDAEIRRENPDIDARIREG